MNLTTMVRSVHSRLTPYKCALADLPVEELKQVLGKDTVYKLSFNENPLGPSPKALQAMTKSLQSLNLYPSSAGEPIMQKIGEIEKIAPEQVILANGADEMITLLVQTFLEPEDEVIIPKLAFVQYIAATNLMGATPIFSDMTDSLSIDLEDILRRLSPKTKAIFLCNPNNPTGKIILKQELQEFLCKVPDHVLVVIDEAYQEYAESPDFESAVHYLHENKLVFVVRTFSKIYSLAGARLGYGIGTPEIVDAVNHVRLPFNINAIVQAGALASLEDSEHIRKSRALNREAKELMCETFRSLGWPYIESDTNFVYVDTLMDSDLVFQKLAEEGIIVRTLKGYGFDTSLRVSIGNSEAMLAFSRGVRCLPKYVENPELN